MPIKQWRIQDLTGDFVKEGGGVEDHKFIVSDDAGCIS